MTIDLQCLLACTSFLNTDRAQRKKVRSDSDDQAMLAMASREHQPTRSLAIALAGLLIIS